MKENIAVIVDPYSSGALLAPELSARGYACLMVQTTSEVPAAFQSSFRPDEFIGVVRYEGDVDRLLAQLALYDVQLVLAGFETGVELADRLSEAMSLPSNGSRYSAARRDKFLMLEAVGKWGLSVPHQFQSNRLEEVLERIRRQYTWPVIVKPATSSGSDNVSLCRTEAEVEQAFDRIVDRENMLGLMNGAAIVQEYLEGTEYVVDTVSYRGEHQLAAYWRYGKPGEDSTFVGYDSMELLPSEGDVQDKLFAYATEVLDALGIRYGPAHCELMWVDNAPMLVEIGARLSAGINSVIGRICGDTCPLDLTIEAYLEPERFLDRPKTSYELRKTAANFFLMPRRQGNLKALRHLDEIKKLRSFHKMSVGAKQGEPVDRVVGLVTLVGPSSEIIQEDIAQLRYLERNGLYVFE